MASVETWNIIAERDGKLLQQPPAANQNAHWRCKVASKIVTNLLLVFFASIAWGQSLQDQKACYVQTQKVASKDPRVAVSNHYDARTQTCWVKEFMFIKLPAGKPLFSAKEIQAGGGKLTNPIDSWYTSESIYNAFEPDTRESDFSGFSPSQLGTWCMVRDTKCNTIAEFEKLAKQRYGF